MIPSLEAEFSYTFLASTNRCRSIPDKKVGVSAALKEKIGFKGCVFPHQDNIVSDVIDETAVSLLDKCIKDPTIADSKGV